MRRLQRLDDMMARYVAEGKSAGMQTLVSHRGDIVWNSAAGYRDLASAQPLGLDSLFRIFSMTKPVTSVALMTLLEAGHCHLDDSADRWIPRLSDLQVYRADGHHQPLERDISIRHLLTHTAGFSYGFDPDNNPVDIPYAEIWRNRRGDPDIAELLDLIFDHPLLAQPGTRWHYSIATDICGRLVEILSGQSLSEFFRQRIFEPLGMHDTGFSVDAGQASRLTTLYGQQGEESLVPIEHPAASPFIIKPGATPPRLELGGAGLISTAADYWRFAQMMQNGGELDGVRILGRKTVAWMTTNHLPASLLPIAFNGIVPGPSPGYGFGLGYCINIDPAAAGTLGSRGDFGWGGLADTYCWVDPAEQLVAILMQQHTPSLHHPGRRDFRNLVYQALAD